MPEQEVHRGRRGPLPALLPAAAGGRGLERPDLPDDRHGGRRDDDARPRSASCGPCPPRPQRRGTVPARRPRRWASSGRRGRPTASSCAPWTATDPKHLALIHEATSLFRGAGYTPFDGTVPEEPEHAAVAYPYAHVTAPLRRLVDRFGLAICEALSAGAEVPGWAREALPVVAGRHGGVRQARRRRWSGPAPTPSRPRCSRPGRRGVRRRWSSTSARRAPSHVQLSDPACSPTPRVRRARHLRSRPGWSRPRSRPAVVRFEIVA